MTETKDPLQGLLLDVAEVDRTRLAAAVKDALGVDTKTGRVVFKPGFNNLTARQKMIAYLLGRKAASLLGKSESEAVKITAIQKETGLPMGTIAPTLRQLKEDKVISQTRSKEYYVESHQVMDAIAKLRKEL